MGQVYSLSARRPPVLPVLLVTGCSSRAKSTLVRRLAEHSRWPLVDSRRLPPGCDELGGFRERLEERLLAVPLAKDTSGVVVLGPERSENYPLSFALDGEDGRPFAGRFRLDWLVSVVDAVQLWSCLAPPDGHGNSVTAGEGAMAAYWPLRRSEATLEAIVEQIECCDALVLLGMGSLGPRERGALEKLLPWLQPRARMVTFETIPDAAAFFAAVAEAPRFAGEATREGATVRALPHLLTTFPQPAPHTSSLADVAFVYRRRRPFHPVRFAEFLERWPENAVRTLGTVWLATADDVAYSVNHFGPVSMTVTAEGYWLAALSPEEMATALSLHPEAGRFWDETYGDRFTELVFVGEGLDRMAIAAALDACLLTDWEMRQDWDSFGNPFGKLESELAAAAVESPPAPRLKLLPGGLKEPPVA